AHCSKVWPQSNHTAQTVQSTAPERQNQTLIMDAIFILEAEVGGSHKAEAGVKGRITQDNHRFIASLPAPLQPLANHFRANALPLKLRQYSHRSQSHAVERGGYVGDGDTGEEDVTDNSGVVHGDEG